MLLCRVENDRRGTRDYNRSDGQCPQKPAEMPDGG
jgi:hypothetical protein